MMDDGVSERRSRLLPRIRVLNNKPINSDGSFIVYWMTATRRFNYNASLERAIELGILLNKPVLVVEGVSIRHKWTSERVLTFMVQGLMQNIDQFSEHQISYVPWVENHKDTGDGLLRRVSEKAVCMIIDDYPTYLPLWILKRASAVSKVRLEAVDSTGVFPMQMAGKAFPTAYSFRRFVQKNLLSTFQSSPLQNPMEGIEENLSVPKTILDEVLNETKFATTPLEWMWRVAEGGEVGRKAMEPLDIDKSVHAVQSKPGGVMEARNLLDQFLEKKLFRYDLDRNNTDNGSSSGLSPWIHFGHISTHEILHAILVKENWDPTFIDEESTGKGSRMGWWGLSKATETFLDQIITWRELGYNFAFYNKNHYKIESIPEWAQKTLSEHSHERRVKYSFNQIENAETDDDVWNAAQRELRETGMIHNYLRMLWGKRILEWSPTPEIAADWMIKLNDRWALDGRDPNSYTGIFWVMGRHDRAWGPERPIFGKIRYMSSSNTKKKLKLSNYLSQWS